MEPASKTGKQIWRKQKPYYPTTEDKTPIRQDVVFFKVLVGDIFWRFFWERKIAPKEFFPRLSLELSRVHLLLEQKCQPLF